MKCFIFLIFSVVFSGATPIPFNHQQRAITNIYLNNTINNTSVAFAEQLQNKKSLLSCSDNSIKDAQTEQRRIFLVCRNYANKTWAAIKTSRRQIFLSTLGVCYAGSLLYFLHGRLLINDTHAWHAWRPKLSLNEFLALPHKNLYEQLRLAMQERYQTPNASIIMNLTDFLNETSHELSILRGYHKLGSRLSRVWLTPIFFVTHDLLNRADEKIKRLLHMRTVIANELEPQDVLRRLHLINCR